MYGWDAAVQYSVTDHGAPSLTASDRPAAKLPRSAMCDDSICGVELHEDDDRIVEKRNAVTTLYQFAVGN